MLERPHILREASTHARGRFVSPLPRLPCLYRLYTGGAEADEYFPSYSFGWKFCVARFACVPCAVVSLHEEADPHTMKVFLVVCGAASVFATREQRGDAVRRDAKRAREYRYSSRTRPAFVAGQFVRAASLLCGLLRIRSPAPRRDVFRPLEKETMRFPQNRTGRADASRSLYCCGGMSLCRLTSRWMCAGNYKLSGGPPRRQALFLPAGSFFLCYFPFFSGEEGK